MINLTDVGNRIKKLRKNSNLSQEVLSSFLDIDTVVLSRIEDGQESTTSDAVEKLSDLFFCSEDYILFGKGDEPEFVFVLQGMNHTIESLKGLSKINKIVKNQFFMDEFGEVPKRSHRGGLENR